MTVAASNSFATYSDMERVTLSGSTAPLANSVKRFCRLTLAFSKKLANLEAAVALYIAYYNWCWRSRENDGPNSGRFRLTPAMQAGLTVGCGRSTTCMTR